MASLNKAQIIGHLGNDPETRYLPDGTCVANASIATTEKWKDKSGEQKEQTEWHRVSFFGKLAEIVEQYLRKGNLIYVEGRIETRKWQDKQGIDRYMTQIRADKMVMLKTDNQRREEAPDDDGQREPERQRQEKPSSGNAMQDLVDMSDDIPFTVLDIPFSANYNAVAGACSRKTALERAKHGKEQNVFKLRSGKACR